MQEKYIAKYVSKYEAYHIVKVNIIDYTVVVIA